MGVATVPERPSVFGDLTVDEHLRLGSRRDSEALTERVFNAFPALADRRNQVAGTLSGGEQQMLAVGRALALRPSVLIVDELSNGLAPKVVGEAYAGLRAIARDGTAVLLVEQFAEAALAIADDVTLLRGGRVVFSGDALSAAGELSRAYLGDSGVEGR
jgi:branched-chain amino acid transport system ATP-binding protein